MKNNSKVYCRSSAATDYENLMENSFNDNTSNSTFNKGATTTTSSSVSSHLLPRWERKKMQKQSSSSTSKSGDRFIPQRTSSSSLAEHQLRTCGSASSFDYSCDSGVVEEHSKSVTDEKKNVYTSHLSSALLGVEDLKNSRVLSYQDKAPAPQGDTVSNLNVLYSASAAAPQKSGQNAKLVARQIPSAPSRILDAPELMDDYYLNLVSWNDMNWLAVALGKTVFLWNAGTGDIEELCTFEEEGGHIASVSWIQEGGSHVAVGLSNGQTELWDVHSIKRMRSMDGHTDRVGSLAWNRHLVTSGSRDTTIIHHDVRVARHAVTTLRSHQQEVCGLEWNHDGTVLASGGNDNLLCLWDASSGRTDRPRFGLTDHQAAVKAIAWSPHERNLLATGAGTADRCIKFWNTTNGALLNSIDTGSQVCGLLWNPYEKEILSSHGFARNQLSLWKYPSMTKIKDLEGHTSRVLQMALGPQGNVLSAGADETLRLWDVFAPPPAAVAASSSKRGVLAAANGLTTVMHKNNNWTMQIR